MSIDNFSLIYELLNKKSLKDNDFFFLQILARKKDNPEQDKHVYLVDNYFIKNASDLQEKRERIIKACELNNARAYFRLNVRNKKKIALETLALVARNIASENYDIGNCYLSVCGQFHSDEKKTWIIDFDFNSHDPIEFKSITEKIEGIYHLVKDTNRDASEICYIPTLNGAHLITPPFNVKEYTDKYGELSYHKDNPTILYCP